MTINTQSSEKSHPETATEKTGVLLVNLGTPDSCDKPAIKRYLAEFLSDRRVIETSPFLWQIILHGFILRTRPGKVSHAYQSIWRKDTDESPLRYYTRRQAELLKSHFAVGSPIIIDWAMRYGQPGIEQQLQSLKEQGCHKILIAPLYPQYSATTTASVNDKVFDCLKKMRWQPAIRTLPPYFDQPAYISTIAQSITEYYANKPKQADVILVSYHGLPKDYLDKGDPYYCHCAKTTRLIREHLKCDESFLKMTFQSRIGPKEWLKPYTAETMIELAREEKHIAVIMPGFSVDCLETLEEMDKQNRTLFEKNGGKKLDIIPCLNDSANGIEMLNILLSQELQGWV